MNPDIVKAQLEGGIAFGLGAALHGKITIAGGKVVQSNFHDYPQLKLSEMPEVGGHPDRQRRATRRRGRAGRAHRRPGRGQRPVPR